MATGYVANWGNDLNDGLSWETAKKSLQGAKDSGFIPIYIKGYLNGITLTSYMNGISFAVVENNSAIGYQISNISHLHIKKFKNINVEYADNCIFEKCQSTDYQNGYWTNVLLKDCSIGNIGFTRLHNCSLFNTIYNETILDRATDNSFENNIIYNYGLDFYKEYSTYNLFVNCKFRFKYGGLGHDEIDYAYPIGTTDDEKLQDLRNRMATVYGGQANDYLVGCKYYTGSYNDIFVDADNDNFYLVNNATNPALHMSYNGNYIGARPPAATTFKIANANTVTNIDQTTGDVIDQSLQASAYWTTIQDAGAVREISSFDAMSEMAYRNGLSINTASYVSADIAAGTNVLTSGKQYQVRDDNNTGGTIVLDDSGGTILSVWDALTAVDEGGGAGLGFSSVDGLTVREIDISKYDERIRIKVSTDDATLSSANEITMLLHETPLVNVDSNNIPIKGNGDIGFDAATAVPLQARYMQIWVDIQADQLYAR